MVFDTWVGATPGIVQMQIPGHHGLVSPGATETVQETQRMAMVLTTDVETLLVRE